MLKLFVCELEHTGRVQAVCAVVLGLFPMLFSLHSRYKVLPLQPAQDNPGVTNANAKSLGRRRRRKRRTAVFSCNRAWIPSGATCMSSEAKTRSQKEDKPVTCRLCLITPWILFTFQERMDGFVPIRLPAKSWRELLRRESQTTVGCGCALS